MALKLSDMKKIKCANPKCDHKNHNIVFRSACHFDSPTLNVDDILSGGHTMKVLCSVCNKHIVSFEIENKKLFKPKKDCRTDDTFTTFKSDGTVEVRCAVCNELITIADVKN